MGLSRGKRITSLVVLILCAAGVLYWVEHLPRYYGEFGQDKWILEEVFPHVRDGFFVDIGSWDAVLGSNSKALEERGWSGICVDPLPRNWRGRSCRLYEEVVSSKAGETVDFKVADELSGIAEFQGAHRETLKAARTVKFTTTTIDDLLRRAGAPPFIHYISIDVEGAEYEVLKAFPFDRHAVGAFTIEHNHEEPKRTNIRRLLEGQGYVFVREQGVDDYYRARSAG